MVKVPAGEFWMGCNEKVDQECDADEKPGRSVSVGAFSIDRTEVTVAKYRECVQAKKCSQAGLTMPHYDGKDQPQYAEFCNWGKSGRDDHPMNCVDWSQTQAYCDWVGKRLPAEKEWEKAARGTDGRKYPWGNAAFGKAGLVANIADESAKARFPDWKTAAGYDDGYVGTAPVGNYPAGASPYGALDMVGNVWEWVADEFGDGRGLRGGSWLNSARTARSSYRDSYDPDFRSYNVGFRCAQ
jgi:formylglycine-generating enzyme required for sulfatase activity